MKIVILILAMGFNYSVVSQEVFVVYTYISNKHVDGKASRRDLDYERNELVIKTDSTFVLTYQWGHVKKRYKIYTGKWKIEECYLKLNCFTEEVKGYEAMDIKDSKIVINDNKEFKISGYDVIHNGNKWDANNINKEYAKLITKKCK